MHAHRNCDWLAELGCSFCHPFSSCTRCADPKKRELLLSALFSNSVCHLPSLVAAGGGRSLCTVPHVVVLFATDRSAEELSMSV